MAAATPAAPSLGPDINLIQKLTNVNDVQRLLHETVARERAIDAELDRLLSKRADLERSFLLLNAPTLEMLELVRADCEQLLASASCTANLATHISSKVRCLDSAQTHVMEVLSHIRLVLDCSAAVSGVKTAMDAEDYEAAAQHIATFTQLDSQLQAASAAKQAAAHKGSATSQPVPEISADLGQADSQRQVLLEAKQKLEVVVRHQMDDAVNKRDMTAAVRFAKLYKPLGKEEEGLKRLIEFLQLVVGAQVRAHVTMVSEQADAGKRLDWSAALSLVFKDIALALEKHEAFVRETFGGPAVLELVSGLQAECDSAGGRVVSRFMEVRKVSHLVREASSRRSKGTAAITSAMPGGAAGNESSIDHKALETAITELLALCRVTEEYNQFMLSKMRQAAGGTLTATRETTFRSGALNVAVRELLGHYMSLEEMYMYETANMAIKIDEVSPGSLTSSMVDDVVYILRKCGMRVLATGSVQVMCALLMELNNVAANPLRNALSSRTAPGPTKLVAAIPVEGVDGFCLDADLTSLPQGAAEYAIALNNSDTAAEYMVKLKSELEGYVSELFPGNPSATQDRERVRSVLQELHRTAGELRQAHNRAVEQLAEALMPRLRPSLDEAATANYSIGEAEYSAVEGVSGSGWTTHLLISLRTAIMWLQPILTPNSYEGCLSTVVDKLVSRLEVLLSRKAFTQLGGLALERDLRALVSHVSELTQRTVRDKFARLNQMALVLGLEGVEELRDYWSGESGMTWRLTAAEVKAVMVQRTDLSKDALAGVILA